MDNSMQEAAQIISELHFRYIDQFLAALIPMIVTVILHGYGMGLASRSFRRFGQHSAHGVRKDKGPHIFLLVAIVAIMLATHFVEVVVWAAFYFAANMLPDVVTAMYFSINSYTTLGASNITLTGRWKGMDGFEAMTAMLMFGWSTAVLAAVVQKTHSIDT
jgi:hypothetical protein